MPIIDVGRGRPLVIVPGLQGRWEWNTPAIRTLGDQARVLTFSLGEVNDDDPDVFERWLEHIDRSVELAGGAQAVIMGVSFGGLIAALYAARRPDRTAALVLVSAPAPDFDIHRSLDHIKYPILTFPVFAVRAVQRMMPEIIACRPTWAGRARFAVAYAKWPLVAPGSPRRMARWVRRWQSADLMPDIRRIRTPTLLVTGEPDLDGVVPVSSTLRYLDLIPGSTHAVVPGTGHMNLVAKPDVFAGIVMRFMNAADAARRG